MEDVGECRDVLTSHCQVHILMNVLIEKIHQLYNFESNSEFYWIFFFNSDKFISKCLKMSSIRQIIL